MTKASSEKYSSPLVDRATPRVAHRLVDVAAPLYAQLFAQLVVEVVPATTDKIPEDEILLTPVPCEKYKLPEVSPTMAHMLLGSLEVKAVAVSVGGREYEPRVPATDVTTPEEDFTMTRAVASTIYSSPFVFAQTELKERNIIEVAGIVLVLLAAYPAITDIMLLLS